MRCDVVAVACPDVDPQPLAGAPWSCALNRIGSHTPWGRSARVDIDARVALVLLGLDPLEPGDDATIAEARMRWGIVTLAASGGAEVHAAALVRWREVRAGTVFEQGMCNPPSQRGRR